MELRYSDLSETEKELLEAAETLADTTTDMSEEEFQIFRNDITARLPELAPAVLAMAEEKRRNR